MESDFIPNFALFLGHATHQVIIAQILSEIFALSPLFHFQIEVCKSDQSHLNYEDEKAVHQIPRYLTFADGPSSQLVLVDAPDLSRVVDEYVGHESDCVHVASERALVVLPEIRLVNLH